MSIFGETEILIHGGYVLTMGPGLGEVHAGDVLVRGNRIVAVAPSIDAPGAEVIEARDRIVMPDSSTVIGTFGKA